MRGNEDGGAAPGRRRATVSLRARALSLLARREQSRAEMRRKLAVHAESEEQVDALLDTLEQQGLLSAERFVESVIHRRAERFGVQRIRHELRQHGVAAPLVDASIAGLERTEFDRARAVWARRFSQPPTELAERARQARFLAARGFSAGVIRRVLGGRGFGDSDED